jgi:hypothetical protein
MRADFHDGSEHNTLQSEAGYIDARPHIRARSTKPSCNARPDHALGQNPLVPHRNIGSRFASVNGHLPGSVSFSAPTDLAAI